MHKYSFECDQCGLCCRNLKKSSLYDDLHDGNGICRYLDLNTKLCTVYDNRPEKCNVTESYKYFKNEISFNKYIELNTKECNKLKEEC